MLNYTKEYKIGQSSKKDSNRKDYYKWEVWIENGENDISEIDYVEYLLHSTFNNRLRKSTDASSSFKIESSGWGEFRVEITIAKKSGTTFQMAHWLKLSDDYNSLNTEEESNVLKKKIFISHSNLDTRKAEQLISILSDLGMEASSSSDIDPGVSIFNYISDEINSSDVVMTINADKDNAWQKAELEIAENLSKRIIPIETFFDSQNDIQNISSKSSYINIDDSYAENLKNLGDEIKKLKI